MGMVLTVERLIEKGKCPKWESASHDIGMDVAKYVDDKIFNNALGSEIECDYVGCEVFYCCGIVCCRPKDFTKAIDWVNENIKTGRGDELKNILEIMSHDQALYFEYS